MTIFLENYYHNRIARKLVLSIILFIAIITVFTTLFQLYYDYKREVSKIEGYMIQIENSHLQGVINSLWEFNNQQLEIELKGILNLPGMEYIEVVGAGKLDKAIGERKSTNIIQKQYPLTLFLKHKEVNLGTLHVYNSLDAVYSQLVTDAVTILISNIVKTFLVAVFTLFLVHHLVTKRLFKIVQLINKIQVEPKTMEHLFHEKDQDLGELDEFEKIVDAVNTMKGGLDSAFKALGTSQKRYKRLFENSPVPLWEEDFTEVFKSMTELKRDGIADLKQYFAANPLQLQDMAQKVRVIDVNKAALDLHGAKTKQELLGNVDKIFTDNSLKVFAEELAAIYEGHSEFKAEAEVKTLNGEVRFIALNLSLEKSDSEEATVLLATTDITKELEIEKRQIQIQKMESIGNLAGGIAHDFNNILSPIIGYCEILMKTEAQNNNIQDDLNNIHLAANRAKELVKQILTFARQSDDELQPIVIQPIVKEVVKFLRSSIPTSITIENSIKSSLSILGNPTQLHQVLMNLCTNAQHALIGEEGTIIINVEDITLTRYLKTHDKILQPGNYVKLTVADNGIGIEPEIIDTIFDPYFTTKEVEQGTGLGLATTYGIVDRSGGGILVESTVGEGTTFSLYWPETKSEEDNTSSSQDKTTLHKGRAKILLVDDEKALIRMGTKILERLGYQVTSSTDSEEALEMFLKDPAYYDLVMTDMTMPNMTGDKLASEIRKVNSTIPVILCTGYSKKINKDSFKKYGITAYLSKPFSTKDLSEIVFKSLNQATEDKSRRVE